MTDPAIQPSLSAHVSPRVRRAVSWSVGTVAFLLYLSTMHPGMQSGDGTELATAAHTLGIPHPTGYPLFMLLSKLWLIITVAGDPIVRLTLLSAIMMAGACAIAGRIMMEELIRRTETANYKPAALGGFAAGIGCAILSFHWQNAVKYEVYAFQFLLMVAFIRTIQRAGTTGRWTPHLMFAALIMGLGMAHHRISSAMIIAWGLCWLYASRKQLLPAPRRILAGAVGLVILGLSLYLYLPIRAAAAPPINWGDNTTWKGFLEHVKGTEYLNRYLLRLNVGQQFDLGTFFLYLGKITHLLITDFFRQFFPVNLAYQHIPSLGRAFPLVPLWTSIAGLLLIAGAVYGALTFRKYPRLPVAFVAIIMAAVNLLLIYLYNIPDVKDYYLFIFWIGWMLLFLGLWNLLDLALRRFNKPSLTGYTVLLLILLPASATYRENNQSTNLVAEQLSYLLLPETEKDMPPESILLTGFDDDTFTSWYRQQVRQERRDVLIFASNFVSKPWYTNFFSPQQIEKYNLRTFPRTAVSVDDYIAQLEAAVLTANSGKYPIYTSIGDPAILDALSKKYRVTPVRSMIVDSPKSHLHGKPFTLHQLEAR